MAVLSRAEIEKRIDRGEKIVIYRDSVLKLDKWLKRHPGGEMAILHMVGRDATAEMESYHSMKSMQTFHKWSIGTIDYGWNNIVPPIQRLEKNTIIDEKKCEVPSSETSSFCSSDGDTIVDPEELCSKYDQDRLNADIMTFPSLDIETQARILEEYQKMHKEVIELGLYDCNYFCYAKELSRIAFLALATYVSFFHFGYKFLSACFLGCAWQQLVFIAHDAGHVSITHNYVIDNIFGVFIASFCGGLSLNWWKHSHNIHHLVTNHPNHDPDIQLMPFFAVTVRSFQSLYSTYYDRILEFDAFAQYVIPYQKYLYYPVLAFGRFNLYFLSWSHIINHLKKGPQLWYLVLEIVGMAFFIYWHFYLLLYKSTDSWIECISYLLISHIVTMIVHVQITLSHFAMSTSEVGPNESFAQRQLRTSMDVACPEWLDFFHGGLQFQVIHHLFPRLPRHNLRKAQPIVLKFCRKMGIKYSIYGFTKGNKLIISHLGEIAQQASTMLSCTKSLHR